MRLALGAKRSHADRYSLLEFLSLPTVISIQKMRSLSINKDVIADGKLYEFEHGEDLGPKSKWHVGCTTSSVLSYARPSQTFKEWHGYNNKPPL
eukprot:6182472-Pleurochrysis_carterae.AAC.2